MSYKDRLDDADQQTSAADTGPCVQMKTYAETSLRTLFPNPRGRLGRLRGSPRKRELDEPPAHVVLRRREDRAAVVHPERAELGAGSSRVVGPLARGEERCP